MGALLVMAEIIRHLLGSQRRGHPGPGCLSGQSWDLFDVMVNKFRGVAIVVGLVVFAAIQLVLQKTKLGIIVRAGVENREIVQVMGYNIHAHLHRRVRGRGGPGRHGRGHVGHLQRADPPGDGGWRT